MNTFKDLKLPIAVESAVQRMGFETPTPIQAQAIPVALSGRDIIGCAQTGTGKTAAFSIPLLVRLLERQQKTGLILAPTRELAAQIVGVLKQLTARMQDMRIELLIGGTSMYAQVRAMSRRPRIFVATPGRLLDHLRRQSITLKNIDVLVLDEADRMLDMGFAPQLHEIHKHLPKERQTLLFSATFPSDIQKLASKFLNQPQRLTVGPVAQPVSKISQKVIQTTHELKNDVLIQELKEREGSVLVFARTRHRTERLAKALNKFGFPVTRIHGDRSQGQRNAALQGFRSGQFRIMVATDIAARGLDISHIAHVINYDLPQVADDYIHRIGRTARAGAEGQALCLVTPEDRKVWRDISRLMDPEAARQQQPRQQARPQHHRHRSHRG